MAFGQFKHLRCVYAPFVRLCTFGAFMSLRSTVWGWRMNLQTCLFRAVQKAHFGKPIKKPQKLPKNLKHPHRKAPPVMHPAGLFLFPEGKKN